MSSPTTPREHDQRARVTRALRAGAGQASVRFAGVGAGLITIPVALDGLGRERFGLWLTMSSVTVLLGSADLGLGNGLITLIAEADGRRDRQALSGLVSSALAGLVTVAVCIAVLGSSLALIVDWNDLFAISEQLVSPTEVQTAMLVAAAGVAIGVAASIGPRVRDGLQQGATVAFWQLGGAAFQVAAVAICWRLDLGLVAYAVAGASGSVVSSLATSSGLFVTRPDLRPRLDAVAAERLRGIMTTGSIYFVLAISATVAYQVDTLVIAARLGADSAATYGVAYRVIGFAPLLSGVFLTPFWPAYAEARSSGDVDWVRRTFRRTLQLSIASTTVLGTTLFMASPFLIRVWTDDAVHAPTGLLVALTLFTLQTGLSGPLAVLLNGLAYVRVQALLSVVMAAANLVLSLVLVDRLGISGPPIATVITQGLVILGPTSLIVHRQLARLGTAPPHMEVAE